jgi:hypothetical protein
MVRTAPDGRLHLPSVASAAWSPRLVCASALLLLASGHDEATTTTTTKQQLTEAQAEQFIRDPEASRPAAWDDAEDGQWLEPLIDNPEYTPTLDEDEQQPDNGTCTPAVTVDSLDEAGKIAKCALCNQISRDVMLASVGFKPLGSTFSSRYNKTLETGDFLAMIDAMCEQQDQPEGGGKWDVDTMGIPPTAFLEYYQVRAPEHTSCQALEAVCHVWQRRCACACAHARSGDVLNCGLDLAVCTCVVVPESSVEGNADCGLVEDGQGSQPRLDPHA